MKIQERYTVARHTSNLKSVPQTSFSASDVLAAAGMTGQRYNTALMLWEVAFNGKTSAKLALSEMLERTLWKEMLHARWKGDPRKIAREVMAWHLHGTCQPCGGRRYKTIIGTPVLSDDFCTHCHGTGKVELTDTAAHKWLADYMSELLSIAGGKVMSRLSVNMEL